MSLCLPPWYQEKIVVFNQLQMTLKYLSLQEHGPPLIDLILDQTNSACIIARH